MIDNRGLFPQDFGGGYAGLACARRSYRSPPVNTLAAQERVRSRFPQPLLKGRPHSTEATPDGMDGLIDISLPQWRKEPLSALTSSVSLPTLKGMPGEESEEVPFVGTRNMPWRVAQERSRFALTQADFMDVALKKRLTTDLDDLVDILQAAMMTLTKPDYRSFKQPYNAHRHVTVQAVTDEMNRKKVLKALRTYPICDVYDLARCNQDVWSEISRELGGISHGVAMKCALEHVQAHFPRRDRAAFWAAVGTRQQNVNHMRSLYFAGDRDKD